MHHERVTVRPVVAPTGLSVDARPNGTGRQERKRAAHTWLRLFIGMFVFALLGSLSSLNTVPATSQGHSMTSVFGCLHPTPRPRTAQACVPEFSSLGSSTIEQDLWKGPPLTREQFRHLYESGEVANFPARTPEEALLRLAWTINFSVPSVARILIDEHHIEWGESCPQRLDWKGPPLSRQRWKDLLETGETVNYPPRTRAEATLRLPWIASYFRATVIQIYADYYRYGYGDGCSSRSLSATQPTAQQVDVSGRWAGTTTVSTAVMPDGPAAMLTTACLHADWQSAEYGLSSSITGAGTSMAACRAVSRNRPVTLIRLQLHWFRT